MDTLFLVVFGLLAVLIMSIFLMLMRGVDAPWAKDVYAIGSVIPKPSFGSGFPGVLVYLVSGVFGAWIYEWLGTQADYTVGSLVGLGLLAGVIRGFTCGFFLALLAIDQGPFQKFARSWPMTRLVHFAGTLLYGLALSLLLGFSGVVTGLGF